MPYNKVLISKSVLINMGDYQNQKLELTVEYELDPGETPEEAHEKVSAQVKALMAAEIRPTIQALPRWRTELWQQLFGVDVPEPPPAAPTFEDDADEDEEADWTGLDIPEEMRTTASDSEDDEAGGVACLVGGQL